MINLVRSQEEIFLKACETLDVSPDAHPKIVKGVFLSQANAYHTDRFEDLDDEDLNEDDKLTIKKFEEKFICTVGAFKFIELYRKNKGTWIKEAALPDGK